MHHLLRLPKCRQCHRRCRCPPMAANIIPLALLQSMQSDMQHVKIKKEDHDVNPEWLAAKRKEVQEHITANQEPGGNPRCVFRRGCHAARITTILGGQGTHECPIVKNVPNNATGKVFIQEGEFYFAGVEAFNHFVPKFPGQKIAFVGSHAFEGVRAGQDSFHLFTQYSKSPAHKYWQGRNAKEGYHYVGKYKKKPDSIGFSVKFADFAMVDRDYQDGIAEYYVDHPGKGYSDFLKKYQEKYTELAKKDHTEEEWKDMKPRQRELCEMKAVLQDQSYELSLTPVEYDCYDEHLYQALVDIGATKETKIQTGRVSIDAVELGYPATFA